MRVLALAIAVVACRGGEKSSPQPAPRDRQVQPEPAKSNRTPGTGHREQDTGHGEKTEKPGKPDDLVDIATIDRTIEVDMRYASERNFTKVKVYPVARCLLRRDAAERLARVQARLRAAGAGLKVWDCYRPFSVQKKFWKLVPDDRYVAEPVADRAGKPLRGSKHNRGAAVDLTLVDRGGGQLEMPTDHDDFSPRAHRNSTSGSATARANAQRLEQAMTAEGFVPLDTEWWHFDAPGWASYPLSDQPLE